MDEWKGFNLTLSIDADDEARRLSALADGELDANEVAQACANWRPGTSAQSTWHAYHLIGDVLRSDDLASDPKLDRAALEKLRERLAREPVMFAPGSRFAAATAERAPRRRLPWAALSAVAAGFAVVAGALIVLQQPVPDSPAATLARSGAATAADIARGASRPFEPVPQSVFADPKLVRDARLDRYLDAHKQFSGVSALGVPSTFLRGATSDASNR